jgi:diacylglycerol kinase (CTP)
MLAHLKTHSDLHVTRKIFHFLTVFGVFLCMIFFSVKVNWIIYIAFGIPSILFDVLRQSSIKMNRIALKVMRPFLRKTEVRTLSGACYAIISVGIVYLIFPKPVAQLSTLFLAVGDPIASFFGLLFGKHKLIGRKSLEGFIAAFIFCSISAYLFLKFQMNVNDSLLLMCLSCGLIGAVAELLPLFKLDDNLTQPLLSSLFLTLLFNLTGGI